MTMKRRTAVELEDGTTGYAMLGERGDDCLRAALATCLQVPPNEVPDPDIDRRVIAGHDPETINLDAWTRLLAWLQGRGLQLVYHDTPAVDCERWIGVWAPPLHTVNLEQIVDDELHRPDVTRTMRRKIYRSGKDVAVANKGDFSGHCVVMSYDTLLLTPWRDSNRRSATHICRGPRDSQTSNTGSRSSRQQQRSGEDGGHRSDKCRAGRDAHTRSRARVVRADPRGRARDPRREPRRGRQRDAQSRGQGCRLVFRVIS